MQHVPAYTDEPHSRIRLATATRLTESKRTAPHFYLRGTCRVDRLLALRAELNARGDTKVSVNDLVVKAVARAHTLVPAMNVIWTEDATRRFRTVDIAVAVASPRGLVTPVVRDVARRSVSTVAADLADLAARAREGKLHQRELEGGSFCVSNLGMYGTEEFSAIINPPQSAILAVGAARDEPVVEDGALAVGTLMRVTLSVDHRPIDGSTAARVDARVRRRHREPARDPDVSAGAAVDPRTTRVTGNSTDPGRRDGSSMQPSSIRAASAPRSNCGMWMVVIGGRSLSINGMSL